MPLLAVVRIVELHCFHAASRCFPSINTCFNEATTLALIWTLHRLLSFIRVYTNKTTGKEMIVGYLVLIVIGFLCFKGYIVQDAHIVKGIIYHSIKIFYYLIGAVSLVAIGAGFYLLIKKYQSSTDPADHNRTDVFNYRLDRIDGAQLLQSHPCLWHDSLWTISAVYKRINYHICNFQISIA